MKIDLDVIPLDGLELSETCNPDDFNLGSSEINHIESLKIDAKALKYGNTATINTNIRTVFSLRCSRCLEEFNKEINNDYCFNYSREDGNRFIDVTDDIRQELILGYSVKNLCKDDCRGLCPKCGKNLNEGNCKCR